MPDDAPKAKKKLDRARMKVMLRDAGQILWRSRRRLYLGIPLILINRLSGFVLPATPKYIIDDVINKGDHKLLPWIVLAAAVAAALGSITDYALAQILGMAAQRSITQLRMKIQQHVQRLPVRYFDSTKTGVLVSRVMNDAEGIRNLVGTGLLQMFGGMLTAILAIGVLFYLSAKLAALILGLSVFFVVALVWAFTTARPLFKKRSEMNAQITGRLTEGLSGIRVVKAYRAEKHEARVFAKGVHELLRLVLKTMRVVSGVGALTTLLGGLIGAIVALIGVREVLAGRMTIGSLMSFTFFLGLVIAPVIQIVNIGTQISEAFAGLERMREVLGEVTEDALDPEKIPIASIDGTVELRDVTFEYTPGVPVLRDVSLVAPAGKSIALVGPSGGGKSTLIGLVAAFQRPTEGALYVDGKPLDDLRLGDYRRFIGIVPQDSFLFADSIYDNIAMGNPKATRDEVLRAARIAHVDEFAERFDDKYDTIVGERGVYRSLDGGVTWQKVLDRDENTGAVDLAFDPANSQTVFAVLWSARQAPWEIGSSWTLSASNGLYRSTDGGTTWRQIGAGLPGAAEGLGRIGLATSPSAPARMYAVVGATKGGGLYRSDDGGDSWRLANADERLWGRDGDFNEVKVDPSNPDVVYVANVVTWKSLDGGHTFTAFRGAPGGDDYHRLWIDPGDPNVILLAGDQGAVVTVNGGETWSSWYNQPTAQFYHVATDLKR